jgi:hypothetical protein
MKYIGPAKDVMQIVFWVIASVIAVLTYRQARKTILQPIRTELFKAQLAAMSHIMGLFLGKDELSLREAFDFEKLFTVNAIALYDAYAAIFFDIQFDRESRPYNSRDCPVYETSPDSMPEVATSHLSVERSATPPSSDPRVRAALWAAYKHDRQYVNREFFAMTKRITELLENPILPQELVDLLIEYRRQAGRNQLLLSKTLADATNEMPEKYPSAESLEGSSANWLHHRWVQRFEHLKPISDQIVGFIRSYFDADNLTRA